MKINMSSLTKEQDLEGWAVKLFFLLWRALDLDTAVIKINRNIAN
jgi:hypothetical protein